MKFTACRHMTRSTINQVDRHLPLALIWPVQGLPSGRNTISSSTPALGRIRETRPRTADSVDPIQSFTAIARQVRDANLLRRSGWFYLALGAGLLLALGGAITGFILFGASWYQLLIAAALGIIFTQIAFIAHEASHRQVLT